VRREAADVATLPGCLDCMRVVVLPGPPDCILRSDARELRYAGDRGTCSAATAEAHNLDPRPVRGPGVRIFECSPRVRTVPRQPEVAPTQPSMGPRHIPRLRCEQEQTPLGQRSVRGAGADPTSTKAGTVREFHDTCFGFPEHPCILPEPSPIRRTSGGLECPSASGSASGRCKPAESAGEIRSFRVDELGSPKTPLRA